MENKHEHHGHHHHHHIDGNTISEIEAIERTTEWRKFIRDNVPDEIDESMVPRAVYISMDDIMALYEKHKDDAKGVRAYFTKKEQEFIGPDPLLHKKPEISVVLVPVNHNDEDMISPECTLVAGESNIYDFTKPCPDLCDLSSPLYASE
ncbi:hypothetical protein SAMN05518672_1011357 [Chitinophaga sp. CF118]|uniref:hypothetical protein n=1 Tax=Chitinophaga sp. CF118 TaxID=1884367 RepID=UPI0008DEAE9A|nr:hypothetical protein [Chitinophaga sp. CF118]SFD26661.1 hypothetical protein SAMN05518672_1011357 [Chitinophaga sp. CF118]